LILSKRLLFSVHGNARSHRNPKLPTGCLTRDPPPVDNRGALLQPIKML
jgi:hypothetical protein